MSRQTMSSDGSHEELPTDEESARRLGWTVDGKGKHRRYFKLAAPPTDEWYERAAIWGLFLQWVRDNHSAPPDHARRRQTVAPDGRTLFTCTCGASWLA